MSEKIVLIIILKIPYHCKSDTSITRKAGVLTMQLILISISPSAQNPKFNSANMKPPVIKMCSVVDWQFISCCKKTHTTGSFTRIVLYTKVDGYCDN